TRAPSPRARAAPARSTDISARRTVSCFEPHQGGELLVQLACGRQLTERGSSPRDAAHLVGVGAGEARDEGRICGERELVALRERAVERRDGEVLVDHPAALEEAEADDGAVLDRERDD